MTSADAIIKVRELIGDQRVGMLTSVAPDGELHSRPISLCELDDTGKLWFLVSMEADWVKAMQAGSKVNVSFADEDDKTWTSIAGTGAVHYDEAKIDRLWGSSAEIFFPGGKNDPNIRLLAIEGHTAEFWDAPTGRLKRLAMLARGALSSDRHDFGESGTIDMK